jgi:hypothetical protein
MNDRHAIVVASVVENVILWDGVAEWAPPDGATVVALLFDESCDIGWTYDPKGSPRFTAPTP